MVWFVPSGPGFVYKDDSSVTRGRGQKSGIHLLARRQHDLIVGPSIHLPIALLRGMRDEEVACCIRLSAVPGHVVDQWRMRIAFLNKVSKL